MANNVADPDKITFYEPSDMDLKCLQMYVFWPAGL